MSKVEKLLEALKQHPPKFFPQDIAYTVFRGEIVKCYVESIDIDWEGQEVSYRYNLITPEEADDDYGYELLYGDDNDTFADEESAKRKFIVPQLQQEISACKGRIDRMQNELSNLRSLDPVAIAARIRELEECVAEEKKTIDKKQGQIKELKACPTC